MVLKSDPEVSRLTLVLPVMKRVLLGSNLTLARMCSSQFVMTAEYLPGKLQSLYLLIWKHKQPSKSFPARAAFFLSASGDSQDRISLQDHFPWLLLAPLLASPACPSSSSWLLLTMPLGASLKTKSMKKGKNCFKLPAVGRLHRRNRPESRFYDPVATLQGYWILLGTHRSPDFCFGAAPVFAHPLPHSMKRTVVFLWAFTTAFKTGGDEEGL